MGYIGDKKKELEGYLPPLTRRADFDMFWECALEESRGLPLAWKAERLDYPAQKVKVYEVSYQGMENTRIYGWYLAPQMEDGKKIPCVIQYHGYSGSSGIGQQACCCIGRCSGQQ